MKVWNKYPDIEYWESEADIQPYRSNHVHDMLLFIRPSKGRSRCIT
jgi:hypothetical protein